MGRELQKKKRRSGVAKVVRKPKSKKQILNNPIIAANWDSKRTLSQNYAKLGLTNRLNKQTGGKERFSVSRRDPTLAARDSLAVHPLRGASSSKARTNGLDVRRTDHDRNNAAEEEQEHQNIGAAPEIRVERDPKSGAILRVIEAATDHPPVESLQRSRTAAEMAALRSGRMPLNRTAEGGDSEDGFDSEEDPHVIAGFQGSHAPEGFIGAAALAEESNPVIKELSEAALTARAQPKVKRKQSERERGWCERIVAKHQDDYRAMFNDRKMNVMQLSEGQIRKKIKAFHEEL